MNDFTFIDDQGKTVDVPKEGRIVYFHGFNNCYHIKIAFTSQATAQAFEAKLEILELGELYCALDKDTKAWTVGIDTGA